MRQASFSRRQVLAGGAASLALAASAGRTRADDYPNRVITVVVPYVAGGPTDAAIRVVLPALGEILGQQLIIENVGGAGGTTGTQRVARAAPDGYTLLAQQTGIATIPGLYPQLPIDVVKSFQPIGMINRNYSFLVGRKSIPANTVAELKQWALGPGKPIKIGHPGVGSAGHITAVLIAKVLGLEAVFVPYRGGAPLMNDIVAGHVDVASAASTLSVSQITQGTIKGFAVGAGKPPGILPQVPSLQEVGLAELDSVFWQALFAPAGTPEPIIAKLNAALRKALAHPEVQKAYTDTGASTYPPEDMTPQFAADLLKTEVERLTRVIRENNIRVGG